MFARGVFPPVFPRKSCPNWQPNAGVTFGLCDAPHHRQKIRDNFGRRVGGVGVATHWSPRPGSASTTRRVDALGADRVGHVVRRDGAEVRQRECRDAVAAVGGADEREQGRVLVDRKELSVRGNSTGGPCGRGRQQDLRQRACLAVGGGGVARVRAEAIDERVRGWIGPRRAGRAGRAGVRLCRRPVCPVCAVLARLPVLVNAVLSRKAVLSVYAVGARCAWATRRDRGRPSGPSGSSRSQPRNCGSRRMFQRLAVGRCFSGSSLGSCRLLLGSLPARCRP